MKDSSPQMQLIRQTFTILLEKFTEHQQNPLNALPEERIFTSLQFQVDHISWYFVNKDGVVSMEEYSFNTVGDKPINAACSISTDAATMLKLCRGDMSFPAAYLSGKLKMKGDQKVLKALGVPMKDALDEVRKRQAQAVPPAAQRGGSKPSNSQPSAATDNFTLKTKIVEAFAPNFKYNLDEKGTLKPTQTVSKDVAVRYKIEVVIEGTDEVWHVSHRYSHFLQLRSELIEQGYTSIPAITSRSSLFNSLERVVHSRIIHLGFFLNECLALVGPGNETLNQFLAKPVEILTPSAAGVKQGSATPPSSRAAGQMPGSAASTRARPLQESAPNLLASTPGPSERERVTEEALEHAWGSPITWSNRDLPHSRYLIRELGAQQRRLDALTKAGAQHAGELVSSLLKSAHTWCLVIVCGVISGYFYEQSFIEDSQPTHFHAELVLKLTFALLLLFPSTRYWCLLYCICWLVAINVTVTGVTAVSEIVNKYSEHWTMYRSHIKWLTIAHSVVVVPEEFRTPPSVAFLLRETVPSTLYNMTLGSAHTVLGTAKSALLSATSVYSAAKTITTQPPEAFPFSSHAFQEWLLLHVDFTACAIVGAFGLAAYVFASPGISRAAWIYFLGWFLIATYATLQITCLVLRLRPSVVETLFDRVDSVMAPFVVMQIGQLRSVFVKFAQYFGGRSDVVSPLWTKLLSELQDACPASSEDYVRRTVEAELGEAMKALQAEEPSDATTTAGAASAGAKFQLEDVFESFCTTPIASASIGQVHLATLKHDALMRILHLQQRRVVSQAEAKQKEAHRSARKARSPDETTDEEDEADTDDGEDAEGADTAPSPIPAPRILSSTSTPVGAPSRAFSDTPPVGTASGATAAPDLTWFEASTDPSFTCALPSEASPLVSVVVKVQHEGIGPLMIADMQIVLVLIKWAAMIDSRWETMLQVMRSWDLTMRGELDYREEASNLREMRGIMERSGLGAATPYPVPGLESPKVLVMTRLFGHKVTDKPALLLHNVDREALLCRIAHCSAYQLLVAGVFNADPHAGNILLCLSTKSAWKPRTSTSNREDDLTAALDGGSVRSDRSFRLPSAGRGRTPSESEASSAPDNNASHGSLQDLVPESKETTYERLIYDATPGKGLPPVGLKPLAVSEAGAASAAGAVSADSRNNPSRRMIYDATPGKGVGFALDDSVHSATPYSPSPSSQAPTPQSASTSRVAGSTPFFPPPRRGPLASPNASVRSAGGSRRDAGTPRSGSFSEPVPMPEEAQAQLVPGLLDFGMTVRLSEERRKAYCRLVIALCDGDLKAASAELRAVGYSSNQSDRAPERDGEFFMHMFRDANPRGASKAERDEFNSMRSRQKAEDIAAGTREKGGRSISKVPDDFLFLTRVVGLLRGLTSELDCSCPILYILALNAKIGLLEPEERVQRKL